MYNPFVEDGEASADAGANASKPRKKTVRFSLPLTNFFQKKSASGTSTPANNKLAGTFLQRHGLTLVVTTLVTLLLFALAISAVYLVPLIIPAFALATIFGLTAWQFIFVLAALVTPIVTVTAAYLLLQKDKKQLSTTANTNTEQENLAVDPSQKKSELNTDQKQLQQLTLLFGQKPYEFVRLYVVVNVMFTQSGDVLINLKNSKISNHKIIAYYSLDDAMKKAKDVYNSMDHKVVYGFDLQKFRAPDNISQIEIRNHLDKAINIKLEWSRKGGKISKNTPGSSKKSDLFRRTSDHSSLFSSKPVKSTEDKKAQVNHAMPDGWGVNKENSIQL